MAKVSLTKLGLKVNQDIKTLNWNDQVIEIKQYLPIQEKLLMMANVINQSADENNFANPVKLEIFTKLEIVFNYTNISFTEKQKEDLVKLYDLLESNKFFDQIIKNLPDGEYEKIKNDILECAKAIYTYRNSAMGVLESISSDYNTTEMNVQNLINDIQNPDSLNLLKDIVNKLG